jgi:hypothetical protein
VRPLASRSVLAAAAFIAIALAASSATAQTGSAPSTTSPAGSWGAELGYGSYNGASLLYFPSRNRAWLLGASFNAISVSQVDPYTGTRMTSSTDNGFLAVGHRWYGGDAALQLRPVIGLGLRGGVGSAQSSRSWQAGGYGELGATYFFTPHLSLGALGEVDVMKTHERQDNTGYQPFVTDQRYIQANLVHFTAGVYF